MTKFVEVGVGFSHPMNGEKLMLNAGSSLDIQLIEKNDDLKVRLPSTSDINFLTD